MSLRGFLCLFLTLMQGCVCGRVCRAMAALSGTRRLLQLAGLGVCVWVTAPAQASYVEQNSAGAAGLEPNEERRQANPRSN